VEVAGAEGDVGEQQDAGGVPEEVATGWFDAGGGPSMVRCPMVEDVEGGWRPVKRWLRLTSGPSSIRIPKIFNLSNFEIQNGGLPDV
jgi:hypothetical protein